MKKKILPIIKIKTAEGMSKAIRKYQAINTNTAANRRIRRSRRMITKKNVP
jgi:hypothetical protein